MFACCLKTGCSLRQFCIMNYIYRIQHTMKNRWNIILIGLWVSFLATACQKVMKVNIAPQEKKFVIEANLSDKDDSLVVRVSKTIDFNSRDLDNGVDDAVVTIQRRGWDATPIKLNTLGKGLYSLKFPAIQRVTYDLVVSVDGQVFTSSSVMPQKVPFDSLAITPMQVLGKTKNVPTIFFKDPPGLGNCYRFLLSVDGFENYTIFLADDKFFDGRSVRHDLLDFYTEEDSTISIDQYDIVRVEMRSIAPPVHQFYNSLLQSSTGESQTASPTNPVSNIVGGALGYFSVHSYQLKRVTVE